MNPVEKLLWLAFAAGVYLGAVISLSVWLICRWLPMQRAKRLWRRGASLPESEPGMIRRFRIYAGTQRKVAEVTGEAGVRKKVSCCSGCGAQPGELHVLGCDVERCPDCGNQLVSCGSGQIINERLPWDGEWPGVKECREFGLWCYWGPPWIPCSSDYMGATEDLNRLHEVADWSASERRWVLKASVPALEVIR